MAATLSTATKNSRATALNTQVSTSAVFRIYDGTRPATPDTNVSSQVLLVSLTCSASAFGSVSNGVLTANAITQNNASATGTATWARIVTSGGTAVIDLDVGTTGTDVIMNTTNIVNGGPVQITSATFTEQ